MAYSKAQGRATAKYDKAHYYMCTVKVPLEIKDKMTKCKRFTNFNKFVNTLILEEIGKDNADNTGNSDQDIIREYVLLSERRNIRHRMADTGYTDFWEYVDVIICKYM